MNTYAPRRIKIKDWTKENQPREKLRDQGRQNVTDAELIAILLGSGSRNENAVSLAIRILNSVDNNLDILGKEAISNLMKFEGIGEAKAITITAAMELGRRRQSAAAIARVKINSSEDAYRHIAPVLIDLSHEEFWLLFLDRSHKVLCKERISKGGVSGTVVDAKIIFNRALKHLASSLILCHNHPSGNLNPSQADIEVTRKLKKAGMTLDIAVVDHLIVADKSYFSFADEAML